MTTDSLIEDIANLEADDALTVLVSRDDGSCVLVMMVAMESLAAAEEHVAEMMDAFDMADVPGVVH